MKKTLNPNPPADFTPTLGEYKDLTPFRYWCQKVLPLVYDDSLSYYELLCKVVDYLNKTMEDVTTLNGDVTDLHSAYVKLQDYVNNYFNNLDIQEEVDNKIDEMFQSGTFNELFAKYVPYATPEMFGAIGDGVADDTQAFITALNNKYVIAHGKYRITSKLDFFNANDNNSYKIITLTGEIICDNGFIHIYGENVTLNGGGVIRGSSPESMVCVGALADEQNISAIKCNIDNIYIVSENSKVGILMRNYFLGNYGCYCNVINNVFLKNTTTGIGLVGDVNGNLISNIIMRSNVAESMFKLDGITYNETTYAPTENNISMCFYYRGDNTPMFLFTSATGNRIYRNTFNSLTCEQFGNNACMLEIEDGAAPRGNAFINVNTNTNLGFYRNTYTRNTFNQGNDLMASNEKNIRNIISNNVSTQTLELGNTNEYDFVLTTKQNENTQFKLFDVNGQTASGVYPRQQGGFVEVTVAEYYNGVKTLQKLSKTIINIKNTTLETINVTETSRITVDGTDINYKTGNNGTSITGVNIVATVKAVSFYNDAVSMVQINEEL